MTGVIARKRHINRQTINWSDTFEANIPMNAPKFKMSKANNQISHFKKKKLNIGNSV